MANRYVKNRHKVTNNIFRVFFKSYLRRKYGYVSVPFSDEKRRAYLILNNHQTPFDQFMLALSFRQHVYFMATEDIFSTPYAPLMKYLVSPISYTKSQRDIAAIKTCVGIAKEGGSIAICPEGNRTYSGETEHIDCGIAKLAKLLKLPIAFFVFHGGYGVQPRWADDVRKGVMYGSVESVLEYDEYKDWSVEKLNDHIRQALYVCESAPVGRYLSNKRAEYLERVIYYCPQCGITHFVSSGNTLRCKTCSLNVEYGEDKQFSGTQVPFSNVNNWISAQDNYVEGLSLSGTEELIFDEKVNVKTVILNKRKKLICKNATVHLCEDKIVIENGTNTFCLLYSETTSAAALGRNKLNVYNAKGVFQFIGEKGFNPVKYVNIIYRYLQLHGGIDVDRKFLGF